MHGQPNTCLQEHCCPRLWQCQPGSGTLHFSRQQCLTVHFTYTPPGCPLNAHLPKNRLLFYLSALLMLTGLTTLQVFLAFYWKIWCNNLHSQLGKLRHGEMNKVMKGQKHRNSPWWSPVHCQCLETVPLRVF